jgi:hypothetical protein
MSLLKLWDICNPVLVCYSICIWQGCSDLSGSQSTVACLSVCARARARLGLREFNICATLNKMEINHNVARVIVFGPKRLGGMSLSHLHTLQGIHRLQYFIGHLATNDGFSKLMCIFIEATQLEVGNFKPFFSLRHSTHGHTTLTTSWVNEIWSFLELFQDTVTLSNSWTPSTQHQNDQYIMSLAILFNGTQINQRAYDGIRLDTHPTIRWKSTTPNKRRLGYMATIPPLNIRLAKILTPTAWKLDRCTMYQLGTIMENGSLPHPTEL